MESERRWVDKLPQVFWVGRIVHGWARDAGREVCSRSHLWLIQIELLKVWRCFTTPMSSSSHPQFGMQSSRDAMGPAAAQVFEHCVNAVRLLQPARSQLLSFNKRRGLTMQVPNPVSFGMPRYLQMRSFFIDSSRGHPAHVSLAC